MFDYLYHQIPGPYQETGGVAPRRAEISRMLYLEKVRARQEAERRALGATAVRLANHVAALIGMAVSRIISLRVTGAARPLQRRTR